MARLRSLLQEERFVSQQELADALAGEGIAVSQSTLSKDLVELGAIRRRTEDGSLVYALDDEEGPQSSAKVKLARLCVEMLQSISHAGNQIVLKTPPGAAQYFASALDISRLVGVMGTIAGDDTVLVIGTDEPAAKDIVAALSEMARSGRPADACD